MGTSPALDRGRPERLRQFVGGLCAGAASLLVCGLSSAATPQVVAPAACGSSAEFAAEVQRRLSPGLVLPPATVSIQPEATGYRLWMKVGQEVRELRDADCRQLFRASVVVTVAIVSQQEPPESPTRAEPGGAPAPAPPPTRKERVNPFELGMSVGAGVNLGLLPNPVPAFELEVKALSGLMGIALGGRYLTSSAAEDSTNRGVTVSAVGGHLVGLLRPTRSLEARLGAATYRLAGSGYGSREPSSDSAWTAGGVFGLTFIPFFHKGVWLGIGADGQVNLLRSRFDILNYGEIFKVPILSGSALLRLGWQFL